MTPISDATTSLIIDPTLADFCDVPHWFDVGLTDVDTPHWLVTEALVATAASDAEIVALPQASILGRELAA